MSITLTYERTPALDAPRRLRAVPDAPESGASVASAATARLNRLLVDAGSGSQGAFHDFYREILADVYRVARRVVRDDTLAEDVTQDALVEAWRKAASFDPAKGSAKAWVLTLAHRRAVDRVRREQRHRDQMEAEAAEAPTATATEPQNDVIEDDFRAWQSARVAAAMDTLSAKQREALVLAYYKGHTHTEVSEALGVPLGTAKTRIRDALATMRRAVKEVKP